MKKFMAKVRRFVDLMAIGASMSLPNFYLHY